MKTGLRVFFLLKVMLLTGACSELSGPLNSSLENREGLQAFQAQNYGQAGEHFTQALVDQPLTPELHVNLGLSYEMKTQPEPAQQSYEVAEKIAQDPLPLFVARFNLGQLLGRAGKIDEALQWYQKALDIKPDSLETKTNIELLIQSQSQQGEGGDKSQPQNQGGQGQQKQEPQPDDKDSKEEQQQPQEKQSSPKYKPRPFEGELSEAEVKKILGEIRQQEQRIRADYNKKEVKERPRDKDW